MARIKLGISLKSLALPFRRSLLEAHRLGASAIEIEASGELAPQKLTATGRAEIRQLLRSHELEASAVVCPLRFGLDIPDNLQQRIDYIRDAMAFAFEIGPRLVIIQAGRLPDQDEDPRFPHLKESLTDLGKHGDRTGTLVALDTGLDQPAAMTAFLDRFDTGSLAVNFNPANLVIAGFNPYEAVAAFGRRLAHVHAQDARRISPNRMSTVPLGHGDLDWMQLLAAFEEVGYRGALSVSGADRAELAAGVTFLRRVAGMA